MPFPAIVDIVLAYRLCYYVYCRPLIRDREYDIAEAEARKLVPEDADHLLNRPGSELIESYPPRIRALAMYLELKAADESRIELHCPGILSPGKAASAPEFIDLDIPEDEEPASRGAKKYETPALF